MSKAVDLWREKLEFLLGEEALASGAQKFALQKQIEEARARIRELGGGPGDGAGAGAAPPAPALDPARPVAGEKRREVFISYAWGDDSPAGRTRAEVAEKLYAALEKDGFAPVRDRDQIQPGELISAFIHRLTRADLVVAVISDRYLRSPYCMFEVYKIWQRCQGEVGELAQRVVPIVLPEVKIGSFEDRVPYLEYWSERAEKLEALIRNPRIKPSRDSWEEVRLVRAFAENVDGILVFLKDVLMPRQLDAHLDHGFPAVLAALQRRIGAGA